jgi:hypothetical protein
MSLKSHRHCVKARQRSRPKNKASFPTGRCCVYCTCTASKIHQTKPLQSATCTRVCSPMFARLPGLFQNTKPQCRRSFPSSSPFLSLPERGTGPCILSINLSGTCRLRELYTDRPLPFVPSMERLRASPQLPRPLTPIEHFHLPVP